MAGRLTSTTFVGRTTELAELESALLEAAAGRPSLAFVAGESGVGKTRLLAELERRCAERHDARVIGGDCVELGEGELPYAPLVAALRPLVRRADPVLEAVGPGVRAELAALAPALAEPVAAVAPAGGVGPLSPTHAAPDATGDPEARGRLFEALLALLDAMGQKHPVLLSIEDLHWADRSTRAFLSYLAASLCNERVLVLCTYRPDELHRRHPLRPLLAELERDTRARRIDLAPLTRDELAEQLADILDGTPEPKLVDRLWTRSEGNPLFAEELLAAGDGGRGGLPPTLRDALMVRVERLPVDAQELLRVVAIAQRADHETLADTGVLEPRALREAVREAVAANILVVDDEGRYAFRHALLREVVEDDLLPGEAAELHRALARALELRMRDGASGVLIAAGVAHHHLAAGDQDRGLATAVRAAQAALEVHAFGEAAALVDRALELWDRVADPGALTGMDQAELLSMAAHARDVDGDLARQEQLLRRALELVDADADPQRAAGLLERLHRTQFSLNRQDEAIATLDRALALVPGPNPSAARAALLATKAKTFMLRSRYRDCAEYAEHAIEASLAAGDRYQEGRARNALGVALMGLGELDAGAEQLHLAMAIAEELDDPASIGSAATNLSDQLHLHGRTREALRIAHDGWQKVREVQASDEWLRLAISEYEFDAGGWARAAELMPDRMRRPGVATLYLHLRRGEHALGRGDEETAQRELETAGRLAEGSTEPQFLGVIGALLAELARRHGDVAAARCAVDDALDRIEFCSEDAARVARVAAVGIRVEADAAQMARDVGDAAAASAAVARTDALMSRVEAATAAERPIEDAYLLTARAEQSRARGEADVAAWRRAAEAWEALERPYLAAQTRWQEAEAALAAGDRDAAQTAAQAAAATAERLGSAWLLDEVRSLAARGRLRLGDDGDPATPAGGARVDGDGEQAGDPFGLTPRERQVLSLVAAGATNREIGERLFMAEKTASVHVSRILAKLDVRSRTEAAGVAHRLGLADG